MPQNARHSLGKIVSLTTIIFPDYHTAVQFLWLVQQLDKSLQVFAERLRLLESRTFEFNTHVTVKFWASLEIVGYKLYVKCNLRHGSISSIKPQPSG